MPRRLAWLDCTERKVDRFRLPEPPPDLVAKLCSLAVLIEDTLNRKHNADDLLAQYRSLCGNDVAPAGFVSYYGASTTEEFVKGTLIPEPVHDPSITDEEFLELIRCVMEYDFPDDNDLYLGYWLRILEVSIPSPNIGQILDDSPDSDPAEILRAAKGYRPICL